MRKKKAIIKTTPSEFQEANYSPEGCVGDMFLQIVHEDFQLEAKRMLKPMNKSYQIIEENKHFYWTMIAYFSRNKRFFDSPILFDKENASFEKGLLVCGNNGAGKTFMFRAFNNIAPLIALVDNRFSMIGSDEVIDIFNKEGHKGIENYYKGQRYFDDIGAEEMGNHYGKQEIFRILLEGRYRSFLEEGLKTFFTTNLRQEELEIRYGKRVESRIYEMFNIVFAKSIDFRKK